MRLPVPRVRRHTLGGGEECAGDADPREEGRAAMGAMGAFASVIGAAEARGVVRDGEGEWRLLCSPRWQATGVMSRPRRRKRRAFTRAITLWERMEFPGEEGGKIGATRMPGTARRETE